MEYNYIQRMDFGPGKFLEVHSLHNEFGHINSGANITTEAGVLILDHHAWAALRKMVLEA